MFLNNQEPSIVVANEWFYRITLKKRVPRLTISIDGIQVTSLDDAKDNLHLAVVYDGYKEYCYFIDLVYVLAMKGYFLHLQPKTIIDSISSLFSKEKYGESVENLMRCSLDYLFYEAGISSYEVYNKTRNKVVLHYASLLKQESYNYMSSGLVTSPYYNCTKHHYLVDVRELYRTDDIDIDNYFPSFNEPEEYDEDESIEDINIDL